MYRLTNDDFYNRDVEFIVLLKAFDESFSQTVYSRSSYKAHEINWGEKFVYLINQEKGHLTVDVRRIDETEKAELTELEEMIDAALKLEAAGDYKALAGEMIFIGYHWGFFEVADGWHTNLARNFGTMKPRKPDITEWIAKTILTHPNLTRPELYDLAPDWITDQLTLEPFKKRVSRVRKKNKK